MKHFNRIVTFMSGALGGTPLELLAGGSRIITHQEKRVFAIRKVAYDDSMTPIYASPLLLEQRYKTLNALLKYNPKNKHLLDNPILDLDNNLQIYNSDEVRIARQGF